MATGNFYRNRMYLKDKKVTIVSGEGGTDDSGFPLPGGEPIENGENIWAYYRHATGDEIYAASSENYKVEAIFKINWRDDLDYSMKIRFKGNDYGITRIDDFEGYKRDLTLYAYTFEAE